VAYFGLLLAFACLSALFSDLLVLPAMLVLIYESEPQEDTLSVSNGSISTVNEE